MKKLQHLSILVFSLMLFVLNVQGQMIYDAQNISLFNTWNDPQVVAEPTYGIKYNGIWGWDDGVGHEYAIIGATNGTYFVDITNPSNPVQVDYVAGRRSGCIWREIKTYSHYAYMISDDAAPNSFQIVDLQYLPDSVHVVYDDNTLFQRAHTLFVDGTNLYVGIVKGGQFTSVAALAVFSLANPELPSLLRTLNADYPSLLSNNQVHDMFIRNDTVYASCAYDGLFIFRYDVPTNHFIYLNSMTAYPSQGYNHSSALTDDGQTLVFMDEVPSGLPVKVLDVSNLQNLTVKSTFSSNIGATPHNPFMIGNTCFMAYYQDGLQVYDVTNPVAPFRLGYFDTHYQSPAGVYSNPAYAGAWGAYPFFPSGHVIVSDMQNGLFVLDVSAIQNLQEINGDGDFRITPNLAARDSKVEIVFGKEFSGLKMLITMSDLSGRICRKFNLKAQNSCELTLQGLKPGLYLVSINAGEKNITRKITIY
ncbi:hypothetical protein BH11BAC2_BH11BAC2_15980 [soil metagenome]